MGKGGKVYLVGAGCGRADLITVRGLRLLRSCDAVVCDDLIDRALLREAPEGADILYMGKRQGRHSASQGEISDELARLAREGKTVVRLKGGDPCVLARGGEEMLALQEAGIPCEVVPGVSSAIAIPALAGIPVTMRGISRSVHIVTAHTADTPDGLPESLDSLAETGGTLVFLMGLSRLERIAERLMAAGMPGGTPAAVLSGGNAAHPCDVRGTLADISRKARDARVRPPAVIVVGEAAALDLSSRAKGPLDGALVGLSGSYGMTERLRDALEELGARTFVAQQSRLRPLPLEEPLDQLLNGAPAWLVLTSANGARHLLGLLKREKVDLRRLAACRIAAIGPATARALEAEGLHADLCPDTHTTRALGKALLEASAPGERILLFRSRQGSPELRRVLEAARPVRDMHLYEAVDDPDVAREAERQLADADYLAFTSAGGARMFLEDHGRLPERATCVCIGHVAADALRESGGPASLVARDASVEDICQTILADWTVRK